jgi:hypothetical protein
VGKGSDTYIEGQFYNSFPRALKRDLLDRGYKDHKIVYF